MQQGVCVLNTLQNYFEKWGNEGVVDLFEEFSKLITLTAARTLLGKTAPPHSCSLPVPS